jgi:hypothetical protein
MELRVRDLECSAQEELLVPAPAPPSLIGLKKLGRGS